MIIMALTCGGGMTGPRMGLLGTRGGMAPMVVLQLAVSVRRLPQFLHCPRGGACCRVWSWLPLLWLPASWVTLWQPSGLRCSSISDPWCALSVDVFTSSSLLDRPRPGLTFGGVFEGACSLS